MVSTPMIVLTLSAIKERMQNEKFWNRSGTRWNCFSNSVRKIYWECNHAGLGNFLVLVNAISYGFYLIIVKKLMDKYNAFTFVKWIYLFGFIMVLPLAGANSIW
jgi:drug/metabolite transporter (DMT)-like permease